MRVLLVGSNPSAASKSQNPFCLSTKSGRTLAHWVSICPIYGFISYCNVVSTATQNNRPLTTQEIKDSLSMFKSKIDVILPDKIVALGKTAEKALTLLGYDFYAMPHPSGLNRKLNDKDYIEEKIKGLRDYINKPLA
jgi:uracil-DNA glycosylase family 4